MLNLRFVPGDPSLQYLSNNYRKMRKIITLFFLSLLWGCSARLSGEDAHDLLRRSSAFTTPFFAPINVGPQVLTAENHKNPETFIKGKYGNLIDAGLVQVDISESNSWRSVMSVNLTPEGMKMADMRRSDHDHIYVMVCTLKVDSVFNVRQERKEKTALAECRFHETGITPFGQFLGFAEGNPHQVPFAFVRSRGSWKLAPRQQDFFEAE